MQPLGSRAAAPHGAARGRAGSAVGVVAWSLVALVAAATTWRFVLDLGRLAGGTDTVLVVDASLWGVLGVLFGCVGALIVSRRAANRIGWLLLVPALAVGAATLTEAHLASFVDAPATMGPALFASLYLDVTGWVLVIFPVLLLAQLYPTGRPLAGAWRVVPGTTLAMAIAFLGFSFVIDEFNPISAARTWTAANPIGLIPVDAFPIAPWFVLLLAVSLGSAATLVARYRAGGPVERVQLRWLLFAGATFVAVYVTLLVVRAVGSDGTDPPLSLAQAIALPLAMALVPLAIAAAVFRYRLWDIDIVIRRTLVYAPLTAIMAGVFSASMGLTQRLFGSLTGSSEATSVLTTVIVVAAFDPIKRSLTRFVDARFKEGPDAIQRWHDYGASLQAFLDLRDASVVARRLLHEAVAAFDARGGRVVVDDGAAHTHGDPEAPVVLELPLDHAGDVLGRLQLGARWNGRPYDERDHALLRARADAVARIVWLARRDAARTSPGEPLSAPPANAEAR